MTEELVLILQERQQARESDSLSREQHAGGRAQDELSL